MIARSKRWLAAVPRPFWVLAVQGTDVLAQLVTSIVVARALGPEGMGEFVFAMSLAALLSVVVLFGTGDVAISLYAERRSEPARVLSSALAIAAGGGLLAYGLAGAVLVVMGASQVTVIATALAIATLLANAVAAVMNQPIVALELAGRDVPWTFATRALLAASAIAAAGSGRVELVLLAYLGAAVASAASRAWLVHRHAFAIRLCVDRATIGLLLRRGRHIGVASLFGTLLDRADAILLRPLGGAAATGEYGASYRLLKGLHAGASALALAVYPRYCAARRRGVVDRASLVFVWAPLALGALSLACAAGAPLIVHVYGDAYASAVPVLRVLFVAGVAQVTSVFLAKAIIAASREQLLLRGQALGAVVNVGANLALVPRHGAFGAAIATLVAEIVTLVVLGAALGLHTRAVREAHGLTLAGLRRLASRAPFFPIPSSTREEHA